MACGTISSGRVRGCKDNAGGVYTIYISTYPDNIVDPFDYAGTPGAGSGFATKAVDTEIITDFDPNKVAFYEFVPNKQSSNLVENYQVSLENETVGYEQVLTAIFSKMQAETRNQIKLMAQGEVLIVVKDKNSKYWLMGANDAAILSGGNAGTGTALADLNGYNLTFTALEGAPMYEVDQAALLGAIGV